jgi:preprotein translocase subunit SecG
MFYIWHTLLVLLFIAFAFFMGYKLGKSKQENKQENKQESNTMKIYDVAGTSPPTRNSSSKS